MLVNHIIFEQTLGAKQILKLQEREINENAGSQILQRD
jgi:hypothetical protein